MKQKIKKKGNECYRWNKIREKNVSKNILKWNKKFKKNVSDVTFFFSNTVLLHIGRSLVTHAFFVKQLSSVAICYLLLGFVRVQVHLTFWKSDALLWEKTETVSTTHTYSVDNNISRGGQMWPNYECRTHLSLTS